MLEDDDEVRVKNVLEVMLGLMEDEVEDEVEDEAKDDSEDELLVEIPDVFGLAELLAKGGEEDDKTEELLEDDGTEVADTLELAEVLLELRPLVLEPNKL